MLVSNESNFLIFSCIVFLFWGYEFQPFRANKFMPKLRVFWSFQNSLAAPKIGETPQGGECFNSASQRQRWHGVSGCRKPRNGAFPGWWTPRPGPRMEKRGATSREPHRGLWSPFEFGRFPRKFSIPFKRGTHRVARRWHPFFADSFSESFFQIRDDEQKYRFI